MRKLLLLIVAIAVAAPTGASALEIKPRCFVTGGGRVNADTFSGSVYAKRDGSIEGTWRHRAASGETLRGFPDQLVCRRNGGHADPPHVEFSIADWTGPGTFGGRDVTFTVNAQDHGEPNRSDSYRVNVSDSSGQIIYTEGGIIEDGNFQIHSANPGHP